MSLTEIIISVIVSIFLLGGCFFIFAGVLGVIRFPDVYCRMHASTKGPTLGMMLIMLGSIIFFAEGGVYDDFASRCILVIVFVLLTNPVGAHMLSKNAYRNGVKMWEKSVQDEWQGKE